MPNQTEASLTRNWAILIALIVQIRGAVAVTMRAGRRNHLWHLLRLAEGLARRWLILKAGCARVRMAGRKAPDSRTLPDGGKTAPPEAPLLRLLEPDPVIRPGDYSDQPFDLALSHGAADGELDADRLVPAGAIPQRVQALVDVMRRPQHHTARMARWLKRAAGRARKRFARRHPLRVGRPPGARRRDRSTAAQAALWWLDRLARDSLLPGWVP